MGARPVDTLRFGLYNQISAMPEPLVTESEGFLDEPETLALLAPVHFTDRRTAERCLRRLASGEARSRAVSELLPHLAHALSKAAWPDRVLVSLDRFIGHVEDPLEFLSFLARNPRAVEILVALFAGSQFLTEILLRNPEYFERLVEYRRLAQPEKREQFYAEAQAAAGQFQHA